MVHPRCNRICFVIALIFFLAVSAVGWAAETAVPPSTNPANHAIFPAKGQDANQQMQDQLAAYNWATQQTGWDPYKAYDQLVAQGHAAQQTAEQAKGGLVRGAARGALVGVAVGAIAGDAGKGAAIGAAVGGLGSLMRQNQAARQAYQGPGGY